MSQKEHFILPRRFLLQEYPLLGLLFDEQTNPYFQRNLVFTNIFP
jgi:hypothetical protein